MSSKQQQQAASRAAARNRKEIRTRGAGATNLVVRNKAVDRPVAELMADMSTWNKFQLARDFPHRWFDIAAHHGWGTDSCREPTQNIPGKVIGITSTYEITTDGSGNAGMHLAPAFLKGQVHYDTIVSAVGVVDTKNSNKLTELMTTYGYGACIGACARVAASKISTVEATGKVILANVPPLGTYPANAGAVAAPTYASLLAYDYQQGKGSEEVHLVYTAYNVQPVLEYDNYADTYPSVDPAGNHIVIMGQSSTPSIHALRRLDASSFGFVNGSHVYVGGVSVYDGQERAGTSAGMMAVAISGATPGDKYELQIFSLVTVLPKNNSVIRTSTTLGAASAGITRPSTVTSRNGGGFDWGNAASDAVRTVSKVASATTAAAGLVGSFVGGPEIGLGSALLSGALDRLGAVASSYLDS